MARGTDLGQKRKMRARSANAGAQVRKKAGKHSGLDVAGTSGPAQCMHGVNVLLMCETKGQALTCFRGSTCLCVAVPVPQSPDSHSDQPGELLCERPKTERGLSSFEEVQH